MSYGPFDLDPGRISYLNFAVMSKLDVPHPCPDVSEIIEDGDFVEAFDEKMDEAIAELNPAPVAVYGFEKTGENEFDFTDQSYFNPTTWMWTFGDGNSSTEQNPTHDYENLGTYEVCLTVTNENGSDMSCNNIILEAIVVAPNAAFSYVDIGLIVDFTDISQNIPTSWFWNFGNGYTSTDQSPTHSYDAPGVYEVCLTATNDVGSDTFCEMISVVFVSTHFPGSIDYILKPNPVSTIAYIEFGKNLGTDSKLKVYNIIGEVVSLPYQLNNQQLELNVEDLAKGLYIFEVTDNDNNFVKGKFLVQ